MKQAICDQAKMELRNELWLDQQSNHYKVVTTMLIHIWNEHPGKQANKFKCKVSFACPTCMHLGTRSYQGTRVKVLEENVKHLARSTRLQSKYNKV